ncbi:MAG: hypothetical protein PHY45_16365 [Rhodocyclaceae bacterium]|nr:hypothetical protein [Rhodocyclaceae bacterium]
MQLPVTLRLKPSPALAGALVLAHGVVAFGAVATALPGALMLPSLLLLALSLAITLRRHVLRPPLQALTLKADGELEVQCSDGRCGAAAIHPQTAVFSWLVTLQLRIDGRNVALALPPDALEAEGHRQLRLWLRWKASAATA